MIKVAENAAAS